MPMCACLPAAVAKYGVSWLYTPERTKVMAAEIQKAGGIITPQDFMVIDVTLSVTFGAIGKSPCS